jgi:asparagine synthase (glutamine-hydrolysing)
MCGIAGWVGPSPAGAGVLAEMCGELALRGPDGEGSHIEPGRVALGFRRLAVIDLDTGDQPLYSEDRTVTATCNGEIYNYCELGAALSARGHVLATRSDAEVIIHLYEERGVDFVHDIHGMFAIALWDAARQRLVLARDRLGVKPLYYCRSGDTLAYASEPQALLRARWAPRSADPRALLEYMMLQYVPAPRSGFAGIKKLHPGSMLVWERGRMTVSTYWRPPLPPDPLRIDHDAALIELDALLRETTRERLRADVPLGAFLSGGVDSSVVVSYMAELAGSVRTFSIDFPHAGFSEAVHARRVAQLYGTEHAELTLTADIVPAIAEAIPRMGEPFADASAIPTYLLSGLTRRHVTVALSGDGGDEAFGGYERYGLAAGLARGGPLAIRGARLAQAARPRAAAVGRVDRALSALASPSGTYAEIMSHFVPAMLESVATGEFLATAGSPEQVYSDHLRLPPVRGVRRYAALDTTTYLPGDLLAKVDRMSMAHALEVRSPLLDHRVHEFAARLPNRLRWRGLQGKIMLKELAVQRGLPRDLVHRRKHGFGVPLGPWFRGELRDWLHETLSPETLKRRGIVRPGAVERMLHEHGQAKADHTTRLWNLAAMELWFQAHID